MSPIDIIEVLELIGKYGPWALACLLALWFIVIISDEDRSARFRARIYGALHRVTGRTEHEKKYIANDIKASINIARKNMCPGRTSPAQAVDVLWVEGGEGRCDDIKEGEFIVRLDPREHQARNIALLATAVVKRTTLTGIRHSVEKPLETAIDLNVVRYLLQHTGNRTALDWFLKNEYRPVIEGDPNTTTRNGQILDIDERGLFTRVLLIELEDFGKRIYGRPPRPYMAGEIEGLVEFLYKIATKQVGHDVPLQYYRAFIRVAVVIVAKTAKVLRSTRPYVLAVQRNMTAEPYSIYVLALDKEWLGESNPEKEKLFRDQLESLSDELQSGTVATKDFDVKYACTDTAGNRRTCRCIRFVTAFR